jgi:hypothetical protein
MRHGQQPARSLRRRQRQYRQLSQGNLYFYNNTLSSTRTGNTTWFRLSTNDETCDARNNIVYVSAAGTKLAMLDSTGVLDLTHNWFKPGWKLSHGGLQGTVNDDVPVLAPGFVDELK